MSLQSRKSVSCTLILCLIEDRKEIRQLPLPAQNSKCFSLLQSRKRLSIWRKSHRRSKGKPLLKGSFRHLQSFFSIKLFGIGDCHIGCMRNTVICSLSRLLMWQRDMEDTSHAIYHLPTKFYLVWKRARGGRIFIPHTKKYTNIHTKVSYVGACFQDKHCTFASGMVLQTMDQPDKSDA